MKFNFFSALAVFFTLLSVNTVMADPIGIFFGTQTGQAKFEVEDVSNSDLSDEASAHAYVGYMFTDWLGLEVGMSDFDDVEVDDSEDVKFTFDGPHVAAVLRGPFYKNMDVFFKLGVNQLESQVQHQSTSGPGGPYEDSSKEKSSGVFVHIGLLIELHRVIDISLSWQLHSNNELTDVNDVDLEVDISSVNIGAQLNF